MMESHEEESDAAFPTKSVKRIHPILKGAERAEALQELRRLFQRGAAPETDGLIAAITRKDPSLLLGPQDRHAALWHHSYLHAACFLDLAETLTAAFEAGMHPDDASLFGGLPVLSMRFRPFDYGLGPLRPPSLAVMKAALRHGADPNGIYKSGPASHEQMPMVQYHANQVHLVWDSSRTDQVLERLAFVRVLLEHGAGRLDEYTSNPTGASFGFLHLLCSSRFALVPGIDPGMVGTEIEARLREVLQLAVRQGAQPDYVDSEGRAIEQLVKAGHRDTVALLLELGVSADASLFDEVEKSHGATGRARLVEAQMRGVVASKEASTGDAIPRRARYRV